jgi:hypothetical protein
MLLPLAPALGNHVMQDLLYLSIGVGLFVAALWLLRERTGRNGVQP